MASIANKSTVCLNMIVRNEKAVIRRCLSSLIQMIDYWVIVDTGSTDDTREIIRDFLKDIPGELHERPWVDFGHNRTEALHLAEGKADFLFIIDADEILQFTPGFTWPELYHDSYLVEFADHGISYERCQLVNNFLDWRYIGVLHEYIHCDQALTQSRIAGIKIVRYLDGARSADSNKFLNDARVLEQALLNEPANDRYMFYLAQSYRDAGNVDMAIHWYRRRIEMKRWDEEVWYSNYQVAQLMEKRGDPWDHVLPFYLQAYQILPTRAEPLFRLLRYYMYNGQQYHIAALFGKKAFELPVPENGLFVEHFTYDVALPMEYAICAYYAGNDEDAIIANNRILRREQLAGDLYVRILANRKYSLERMYPAKKTSAGPRRKMKVIVLFTNAGHYLDNCIETLLQQEEAAIEIIFLDNGSSDGSFERLPLNGTTITAIRNETVLPEAKCLHELLIGQFENDDLCYMLRGDDWLEHSKALSEIKTYFELHDCLLLYTQFRFSDGRVGLSMPWSNADKQGLEGCVPLSTIFVAGAYGEMVKDDPDVTFLKDKDGNWLGGGVAQRSLSIGLIGKLGAKSAHFNDMIPLVCNRQRLSGITFPGIEPSSPGQSHTTSRQKTMQVSHA